MFSGFEAENFQLWSIVLASIGFMRFFFFFKFNLIQFTSTNIGLVFYMQSVLEHYNIFRDVCSLCKINLSTTNIYIIFSSVNYFLQTKFHGCLRPYCLRNNLRVIIIIIARNCFRLLCH